MYSNVFFWITYLKKGVEFLDKDINDVDFFTEASVPTPPDQEDVSPIDMVSDAVEEVMDNVLGGLGLNDKPAQDDK